MDHIGNGKQTQNTHDCQNHNQFDQRESFCVTPE